MKNLIKINRIRKVQGDKFLCSESCRSSSKFISFDRLIKTLLGVAQKKPRTG